MPAYIGRPLPTYPWRGGFSTASTVLIFFYLCVSVCVSIPLCFCVCLFLYFYGWWWSQSCQVCVCVRWKCMQWAGKTTLCHMLSHPRSVLSAWSPSVKYCLLSSPPYLNFPHPHIHTFSRRLSFTHCLFSTTTCLWHTLGYLHFIDHRPSQVLAHLFKDHLQLSLKLFSYMPQFFFIKLLKINNIQKL